MAKTALTNEERDSLKGIALELAEIRRQLDQITETLAKLGDTQFVRTFCEESDRADLTERQVDNYQLALQKQADAAKSEFRH